MVAIRRLFSNVAAVAVVGTAAFLFGLSGPVVAAEPADWLLENCVDASGRPSTQIADGVRCDLKNSTSGTCLVQRSHSDQADWDFAACSSKPRNLKISAGAGPISCGQTVAIKLGTEYYRKCVNPQTRGINICSEQASAPQARHFDWQFAACTGQLDTGKPVALYNVSRKDSVVYAARPSKVVDTCWADKVKYAQCTTSRDK